MGETQGYAELAADLTVDTTQHLASLSRLQAEHALTVDKLAQAETERGRLAAEIERLEDLLRRIEPA